MSDEPKPEGYYDPDSPNYWKLTSAKQRHTQMVKRIWAPGDTYHVCTSCEQQVNIASDGRQDCDAALLIRENARLEALIVAALDARQEDAATIEGLRAALEEVHLGLQNWIEAHGDQGGHIVGLMEITYAALTPTEAKTP